MQIIRTGPTERIVIIGMDGTGKTYDVFTWFSYMPEDARLFYMDSDDTVERFLASNKWSHLSDRIVRADASNYEWPQYRKQLDAWKKEITSDDLVCIDRAGEPWDMTQNYYIERVLGMEMEEYLLTIKSRQRDDAEERRDLLKENIWQGIKTMYGRFTKFCTSTPGNLVLLASEKPFSHLDSDNPETMKMWASVGAKPEGEKHLGNLGHTVIRKTKVIKGPDTKWVMTTTKDRERELVSSLQVSDFALDYLIPVAGWEIK